MSKHTPGPWVFEESSHVSERGIMWPDFQVSGPNSESIADVGPTWSRNEPETEAADAICRANARLIAAAPDLLEALRNLEIICRRANDISEDEAEALGERYGFPNGPWSDIAAAAREHARTAMSKAEGK